MRPLGEFVLVLFGAVATVATAVTLLVTQQMVAPFFTKIESEGPAGVIMKDAIAFGEAQVLLAMGILAIPTAVALALFLSGRLQRDPRRPRP